MSIVRKLSQIEELPVLPEIMVKVRAIIDSDDSGANELAKIIEKDPAISSTVLKTANSAYYNISRRQINSIPEAITRIGFNEVQKITVALSVIKQFTDSKSNINYRGFWKHSIAAASLSTLIIDMGNNSNVDNIREHFYMSGLLHDIGTLVLDQFFHKEFALVLNRVAETGEAFLEAEKALLMNENHPFVGGALLEIWKLSSPVISAVRYHHDPHKAPQNFKPLVSAVHIAEYILCNTIGAGSFEGPFSMPANDVWESVGIIPNDDNLLDIKKMALEEMEKASVILNSGATTIAPIRENRFGAFTLRRI